MNETRDLLERVGERFAFPDEAFERLERRRDRRRRNQRMTAGVIGIAAFVAVVWIVATAGSFDRALTPATTGSVGPTGPPHPTGVGLLGLPPEGATPSTPEHGDLVVGIGFGHTGGDPGRFSLHVYADGRVIWQWIGGPPPDVHASSTGLIEQRLTPEGVELVRAEVLSTGLFDHDRVFVGAPGLHYGGIEVRTGDRLVQLAWGDAGFEEGIEAIATTPTPEQVDALERLDARLEDLASWLPASAWEDPGFRAYVASRYSVCYMDMGQGEPLGRLGVLDLLPAPAEDLLRTKDTTQSYPNGFRDSKPFWCSVVTTEEARELAEILGHAGGFQRSPELSYAYSPAGGGAEVVDIGLGPVLPHE
jgi:hypothetical protein